MSEFKRCTLVAMAGAHVEVKSCNFSNDTSKCEGLGLLASGTGTSVIVQVRSYMHALHAYTLVLFSAITHTLRITVRILE